MWLSIQQGSFCQLAMFLGSKPLIEKEIVIGIYAKHGNFIAIAHDELTFTRDNFWISQMIVVR